MRYKVVVVRDRAADVFGIPNFVSALGVAVRSFGDEVKRKAENNPLAAHPEDFDLFSLGEYDDSSGEFICDGPKQIAVGKDYAA